MTSEERNARIEDCLIDYHNNRSIPSACEACDLLFEELMSSEDEEGEEMCKKIDVVKEDNRKKINDLYKEIKATEKKLDELKKERAELIKKEIEDKVVVIEHRETITPVPVVVVECHHREWPFSWDVWY